MFMGLNMKNDLKNERIAVALSAKNNSGLVFSFSYRISINDCEPFYEVMSGIYKVK